MLSGVEMIGAQRVDEGDCQAAQPPVVFDQPVLRQGATSKTLKAAELKKHEQEAVNYP
jgi:hypothetical protein